MFGNRHPASEKLRGLMDPTCKRRRQRSGDWGRRARTNETRVVGSLPIRNMRRNTKVKNDARVHADTPRTDSDDFVSGVVVVRPREVINEDKPSFFATFRARAPRSRNMRNFFDEYRNALETRILQR